MPEDLPTDWRIRLVEMIRGAEAADPAWFTGGPVCTPSEQLGIYVEQYRLRLFDALVEEIPGLWGLIRASDGAEPLLRRYLRERPSRTFTLNRVAHALPGWLAEQPGVPVEQVEMAALDHAVQEGFEAAGDPPLEVARLASMPRLRLQAHVRLLRLTTNVHEIRSVSRQRDVVVPELRTGDFPIVVFRSDLRMRHWLIPLPLWGILEALDRGLPLGRALDEVFARGWVDAETLGAEIGGWFQLLAERRLVAIVESDAPQG